jgi:hypothetical protein
MYKTAPEMALKLFFNSVALMLLEYLRVHLLLLALVYVKGGHMMRCY